MSVAIVGGGVAGCYSAFRLGDAFPGNVQLFEMADRLGGRLWSVALNGVDAAPVDLGGMFFSTLHRNVHALVTKRLNLPHTRVNWSRGQQFVRGKYLHDSDYGHAERVPFVLAADENLSPELLLLSLLKKIVPGFADLWPFNESASPKDTFETLRTTQHGGRPLYDCGFWNVLNDIASNEAYQLLTCTIGSASFFRNSNAFDAVWNLMQELAPQEFYRIDAGYQSLANALVSACDENVELRLRHRLIRVSRERGAFSLLFESPEGELECVAQSLILAMPRRALQLVEFGDDVFPDREAFENLRDQSVASAPASKIFLTFSEPWWDQSNVGPTSLGGVDVSAAYTDLPIQQCYYFGAPHAAAPALLMASYADDRSSSFWAGFMHPGEASYANAAPNAASDLECPGSLVEATRRQLDTLHDDVDVPSPTAAIFVDWSRDPYGGGWHAWTTRVRSWEARAAIRNPTPNLYICGEAYSDRHGWTEGAINSAEMVVQLLGAERPDWVDEAFQFEQEGEVVMANRVSEMLVALGESMTLQRVFARKPDEIMDAFGLDTREQAAVKSGDPTKVKEIAGEGSVAFIVLKHSK